MRLLRLLALAATLAAVYFAQYIFDHLTLAEFFPERILRAMPSLAQYSRWLTNDLLLLAMALAALAALAFGLLTPPWRGWFDRRGTPLRAQTNLSAAQSVLVLLAGGIVGVTAAAALLWLTGREGLPALFLWGAGVISFLGGAALADGKTQRPAAADTLLATESPTTSTDDLGAGAAKESTSVHRRLNGGLIFMLILAALLFGWQLAELPIQLDDGLASFSIEALRGDGAIFMPGAQGLPRIAYASSAAFMQIGQNILVEMRLAGLMAGLLTVLATWLVGRELFRRVPIYGSRGEIIQDDGRWMATLAAAALAITIAMLHFARLPFYMEPVAWGVLGLWLWLRGQRRAGYFQLGLSGMLLGLAVAISPVGLVFPAAALLWWLAVALFNPAWMAPGQWPARFALWCGGLWLFGGPLAGSWLAMPERLRAYVQAPAMLDAAFATHAGLFGLNLRRTLFAFNYTADTSAVFAFPAPLLHSLLAPLFILAIGALLLNIDTWLGWTLLTWLTTGALVAAWLGPRAPFVPVMLPLLPAVALALAFALDRLRVTLLESVGAWLEQATVIVMAGLLTWVGINSWLNYYPYGLNAADVTSEVARAAHAGGDAPALILVNGYAGERLTWRDAPLLLVQSDLPQTQVRDTIDVPAWPVSLPPATRLFIQPADRALIDELPTRYPGGTTSVARDLAGNPVVYIYDLP